MNLQKILTSWTIRQKLLLLLLVIFLPAFGIIVASGLSQRRDAILKAQNSAFLLAQSLAAQQEQVANTTKTMLSILAQVQEVQRLDAVGCNELFRELHRRYPFYTIIMMVTPDGNAFAASEPFEPGRINLSDRKHIKDAIRTRDFSVGEYLVGRVSHVVSINYTFPVLNPRGKLIGILIAGFNMNEFSRFVAKANLPAGYAVTITDYKGVRFYRLPANDISAPGEPIPKDAFAHISGSAHEGSFERTGQDNLNRIYAFRQLRLKDNATPYLYMLVGIPKDRILLKANLDMLSNLSFLGIAALVAMSLAWVYGNLVLIQPLNRLVTAAQQFGLGEMDTRTGLPHTSDELGRLARSFDDMASLLETRHVEREKAEEALGRAYAEMEARVQERTTELAASNAALMVQVAQRQRAQTALEESLSLSQATLESTADGILVVNRQGRMVSANRKFREMWRLPEEILASGDDDQALAYVLDQLQDPEGFLRKVKELYAQPAAESFDILHFKDGRVFERYSIPHFLDNQIVGRVWSFRDVSIRVRAEEALRDNEQFLTDIFNSIQDGLSILDPELNIIRVNPAMENFGYTKPLVGKKCYEVYHQRRVPCEVCPSQQTLLTGKASREIVTEHLADGSDRFIEIHAFPLLNRTSGQTQAVVEFARDVTERLDAEAERLRLSKLESLSTLAGGIAHDFNNILTAILGNISLARLDLHREGRQEILAEAEKACLQAQKLSKQLLTFAKGGAPVKKLLSVAALISESASFTCRGSQVNNALTFPADLWPVEADPGQIGQAFQNLLINAIQAMPNGGTINIRGENLEVQPQADLPLSPGKYVRISIQDQGIGIPEDYLQKIFDPYFTTKQTGSGLGLATAYSIVRNHHGYLSVASKLGAGTTFQVYLPASDRPLDTTPAAAAGKLHTGKGKILVMDDEELVRNVLGSMLNRLGYEVEFAATGAEAVQTFAAAQASGNHFVAAIMDLTIPGGMGGQEAMAKLREIDPHLKGIVSSGYSDDPIMAHFSDYGFNGVIHKPYRISELSDLLKEVFTQNT